MLPINTLLATKTTPTYEDTETVLITRAAQSGLNVTTTTIYNGPGDFQASSGGDFYDPSGAIQTVDAILVIDPAANGSLPAVLAEDTVTVAGVAYSVILVETWAYAPIHLEIQLKRGPQAYRAKE